MFSWRFGFLLYGSPRLLAVNLDDSKPSRFSASTEFRVLNRYKPTWLICIAVLPRRSNLYWGLHILMALWRIPILRRRLFGKRRFAFVVVVASLPFMGYLMLLSPWEKQATEYSFSTNTYLDCPTVIKQHTEYNKGEQTTAIVTSTVRTLTANRKIDPHSSMSNESLNVHMWSEICGTEVDSLRDWPHFPYFPDKSSFIDEFYKSQRRNSNNGERIFGFLHPLRSGEYKFAITSDDASELWLSPNEDPASAKMIARVYSPVESAWTRKGDFNKYPDQISYLITLQSGKKYYIESLSKQGSGLAHVAVYWSYSSSNLEFEIISSTYLSTFSTSKHHETIPVHAGKQRVNSQSKSKLFDFYRLPFIRRKEYNDLIQTCPNTPSFLVRGKLQRYQGISLTRESQVFPQDDTNMLKSTSWIHQSSTSNPQTGKSKVEYFVDKFVNYFKTLQSRLLFLKHKTDLFKISTWKHPWSKPNPRVDKNTVEPVVNKFIDVLRSGNYFLKKIHNVIYKPDPKHGDRFLLNLELGLGNTNQSFRLSEHVYQKKGNDTLCLPEGFLWNNSATVYFILPVKDQGKWVHHFINQLTEASLLTGDTNFHVIVVDFESKDIDMSKAFNTSLLRSRHTIVSLTGKFFKTLALNKAAELVPNAHDIIFLFDLHIDVPPDIMDSVRMNTITGRMAYFPIVGRLDCGSSSREHQGFWEMHGYGIMAIYKSDWDRFGGMNTEEFKYKWGGEDWDLLDRVLMLSMEVERIRHPGLYHHYHSKQNMWS